MQNPFPLIGALVTKGWVRRNFAPIGGGGGGPVDETDVVATAVDLGAALSGAVALDLSAGNLFHGTVTGDATFALTNAPATGRVASFTLELTNGGAHALAWTGGAWDGGAAPTFSAAGTDVVTGYTRDGGATVRLFAAAIGSA